jgi:dTDP-4-amino-4,6-dideoxygalactose transaminase
MWARKRIDVRWSDLALALGRIGAPVDRRAARRRVERLWSDSDDALACLSVRSGFDLLWQALGLPAGSEVLVSAITIPHMPHILRRHGLVPIPLDLEPDRLAPRPERMRRAITPATRAVVVAHLFGSRFPIEPTLRLAAGHGLLVVEDCAQSFSGTDYTGHPAADVSMFSFGPIKSSTALGGALLTVRDPRLLHAMRLREERYPVQTRAAWLARLAKYAALKAVSSRVAFGALVGAMRATGRDPDRAINGSVRGFRGADFSARIRRRPSAPLLALLARRLQRFDAARLDNQRRKAELFVRRVGHGVACPTSTVLPHTHWVLPVLVDDPPRVMAGLRRAGFDATQGHSLCVVDPPDDRPELEPPVARHVLAHLVFLPFYPEMPPASIERMAQVLLSACGAPPRPDGRCAFPSPCSPGQAVYGIARLGG